MRMELLLDAIISDVVGGLAAIVFHDVAARYRRHGLAHLLVATGKSTWT